MITSGDVASKLEQSFVARLSSAQNPLGVRPAAMGDLPVECPGPAGRRQGGEARMARVPTVFFGDVPSEGGRVFEGHRHFTVIALESLRRDDMIPGLESILESDYHHF